MQRWGYRFKLLQAPLTRKPECHSTDKDHTIRAAHLHPNPDWIK